jgi:hypothetical protein
MDSTLLAIVASIAVASYAIWAIHRLYLVFGKCPRCRTRLNRTAEICGACGCRQHEYTAPAKSPAGKQRTATSSRTSVKT